MTKKIIDIASWAHPNGQPIDWEKVKTAGVAGVSIKVTQGTGYANPFFAEDYKGATEASLLVGAYHYCQPADGTASAEAAWCNNHVMGLDLSLGLWLDLEIFGKLMQHQVEAWATEWLTAIEVPNRTTGVYLDQYYCEIFPNLASTWPLWQVTLPGQEQSHNPVMVQTEVDTTLDGIPGSVDIDELISLRHFNPPAPTPKPTPEPTGTELLEEGSSGGDVGALQTDLNILGAGLAVDGIFGPLTKAAVVAFQEAQKIGVDGIVGPQTRAALTAALAKG